MAKLTTDQWAEIRLRREGNGESFPDLASAFGVSHQAIQKRSAKEGWGDGSDSNALANRIAMEKVAGVVAGCNHVEKLQSVFNAANHKAEIIERQQADWAVHREAYPVTGSQESLKDAKLSADMLKVRHDGERRAHGIDEHVSAEIIIERSYGAK